MTQPRSPYNPIDGEYHVARLNLRNETIRGVKPGVWIRECTFDNIVRPDPPVVRTGPDGSEEDRFKRDPLNLLGLLIAAIILTTFYFGFRAVTDHLTDQPEDTDDKQQLNSTDRSMPAGGVREPDL